MLFDDQLDATGTDIYEFIAGDVLRTPLHGGLFRSFDANGVERRTLRAAGGANSINVSGTASELRIHANGGNDNVTVSAAAAPVIVDTGTEAPTAQVPGDALTVNADVNVDGDDRVARLTVNAQGVVHLDGRATLDVTDDLVLTGAIDLGAGAFVVRSAAADYRDVETWLRDGYAGGAWNGTAPTGAINSSVAASSAAGDAVGLALASDLFTAFPATFAGAADVGAGDVLLRHTLYGDANLDARVNLADFNRLASSFGQTGRRWVHGDSDFTSEVNLSDFNRLASNFGNSASAAVLDRAAAPPRRLIDGLLKELLA